MRTFANDAEVQAYLDAEAAGVVLVDRRIHDLAKLKRDMYKFLALNRGDFAPSEPPLPTVQKPPATPKRLPQAPRGWKSRRPTT